MKGKELAMLAMENRTHVAILENDQHVLQEKTDIELRRLQYDVFQPKVRALEEELEKQLDEVKNAAVKVHNVKVEQIKTLMVAVKTVERILEFFRLDTKQDLKTSDDLVKYPERYQHYYRENLGVVFSDQYLEVRLFILQNDKPTNKYQLVLVGKCLFDNGLGERPLLKLPCDYGITGAEWASAPQQILKEASSVKELHSWWLAHGFSKVSWLKEYLTVKGEYEYNLKNYKVADFQDFITWQCPTCNYFRTIFEYPSRIQDGVELCPRDKGAMVNRQPVPKK